jgi:hypothetical protein
MRGDLSAKLSQAELVGQPIEETSARFIIKEGEVLLEHFTASSKTAFLNALGSISRDLNFDFKSQARGIKLSGTGIVGPMQAQIDAFEGNLQFKLDEAFLTSPLKNLNASGKVTLSHGAIGEQRFDSAQGTVALSPWQRIAAYRGPNDSKK